MGLTAWACAAPLTALPPRRYSAAEQCASQPWLTIGKAGVWSQGLHQCHRDIFGNLAPAPKSVG